ncbi:hypothetical protein ABMC88_10810, partial [Sulfitobacter sp. HNIBRBA2951]|uniref:hypothetical protein n=1 Tax=Sulfitobacter aquimarinus TaxID=3158557 RepID=UPI0032DE2DB7
TQPFPEEGRHKRTKEIAKRSLLGKSEKRGKLVNPMLLSSESDASIIDTINFSCHKNMNLGSKVVKVMVHYTIVVEGRINLPKTGACF